MTSWREDQRLRQAMEAWSPLDVTRRSCMWEHKCYSVRLDIKQTFLQCTFCSTQCLLLALHRDHLSPKPKQTISPCVNASYMWESVTHMWIITDIRDYKDKAKKKKNLSNTVNSTISIKLVDHLWSYKNGECLYCRWITDGPTVQRPRGMRGQGSRTFVSESDLLAKYVCSYKEFKYGFTVHTVWFDC